jgi:multisubunit Na+/H+ antiporter MnhF subunit
VNVWLVAASVLAATLLPLGFVCLRAPPIQGVVAGELAGTTTAFALLCLAEGFDRSTYFGVGLVAAVLAWFNGLLYARFLAHAP